MTSIVVVSHSHKIAEGVKQLINQMTDGGVVSMTSVQQV